ncbi:MAG: hypothetical protein ACXV8A_01090 [Chthoniobacterales bacterium]
MSTLFAHANQNCLTSDRRNPLRQILKEILGRNSVANSDALAFLPSRGLLKSH